uniref:Negative elongation factor D n=1 Tax=Steinernema glaseri TaxID=37863 RepID=A0A1I7YKB7_9BILA
MAEFEEPAVQLPDDEENRVILEHCAELFAQPDFVMEPEVKMSAMAFIQAKGEPEDLIERLSENYLALGQTCNLIGDWLADLELEDTAKPKKPGRGRRKAAPVEPASGAFKNCASVHESLESTMASLISRHFSMETVDRIFETDSEVGTEWLPQLITHKAWRRLVYDLSEKNPQCLMLTFCVKLISEAGFQHEISSVNTAARQLDIFCGVLVATLDSLLSEHSRGPGTESYERAFGELVKVACHSEHTYLYTQTILKVLMGRHDGMVRAACGHIANALRDALHKKDQTTAPVDLLLLQSPEDKIPQNAVQAIQTMVSKRELNPGDVVTLHQATSSLYISCTKGRTLRASS